ncbi:gamma-glutamylcyclotransferase [Aestuariispira insulae]|uniref:glutathione-specific gamma-glutamylcyclotransferase n=1 Tax=Aestuariispira insulae TaxID=1461337 RepID=A0A3D9HXI5_9PROT|nr:gamma-glutamylcyclotransferase [Aestuariispira insulae]RED54217.1 cation transport protein ChaC [Aestuariispira insulae]
MSVLNRDSIKNGFVQKIAEEGERLGLVKRLSVEERVASREATLARKPDHVRDIWVFAYGSLMWNPAFHHVDSCRAKLFGYHRAFCLKAVIGRGTMDYPGLLLGLEHGGSCLGLALKVDPENVEEELDVVWSREMVTGAYRPAWVTLASDKGPLTALTFLMNRDYERYVRGLGEAETARLIATAEGPLGKCSDYLEQTVIALDQLGIADGPMHRLWERVENLQKKSGGGTAHV